MRCQCWEDRRRSRISVVQALRAAARTAEAACIPHHTLLVHTLKTAGDCSSTWSPPTSWRARWRSWLLTGFGASPGVVSIWEVQHRWTVLLVCLNFIRNRKRKNQFPNETKNIVGSTCAKRCEQQPLGACKLGRTRLGGTQALQSDGNLMLATGQDNPGLLAIGSPDCRHTHVTTAVIKA